MKTVILERKMPHSHKVLLIFIIALVISAISAYFLLDFEWLRSLIPVAVYTGVARFSVFSAFFILIFDFMVLMIEEVRPAKE